MLLHKYCTGDVSDNVMMIQYTNLLLIIAVLCLSTWLWIYRQKKYFETKPPGPTSWPIIGNIPSFFGVSDKGYFIIPHGYQDQLPNSLANWNVFYVPGYMLVVTDLAKKYGTPYSFNFGMLLPNGVVIDKPEHMQVRGSSDWYQVFCLVKSADTHLCFYVRR